MTNETTASQPKSIGDDAQPCPFCGSTSISQGEISITDMAGETVVQSMCEECGACGPGAALQKDEIDYGDVKAAAKWNSRAPAAQASATKEFAKRYAELLEENRKLKASATIQAAPEDDRALRAGRNMMDYAKRAGWPDDGEGAFEFLQRTFYEAGAATIQEPVMVAEPVGVVKPCGWLAGNSSDGGEMMYWKRDAAQSECDQHNAYERSRPDFDPEVLREPEPVYAAPMVADPAGVALDLDKLKRVFFVADVGEIFPAPDGDYVAFSEVEALFAATVKAVPNVALDADDVEWVVNDNAELGVKIGNQFFFLYKGSSLVYEDAKHDNGKPMMWRPVFKREFGECAHPINHADYSKIGTVSLGDSEEWKPLDFAAPLADKTDRGE